MDKDALHHAQRSLAKAFPKANLEARLGEHEGEAVIAIRGVRTNGSRFFLYDTAPYIPEDLVIMVDSLLKGS